MNEREEVGLAFLTAVDDAADALSPPPAFFSPSTTCPFGLSVICSLAFPCAAASLAAAIDAFDAFSEKM